MLPHALNASKLNEEQTPDVHPLSDARLGNMQRRITILQRCIVHELEAIATHDIGPGSPPFIPKISGETRTQCILRWQEVMTAMQRVLRETRLLEADSTKRQVKAVRSTTDERNQYPVTPDGRYFVVKGRLWRRSNPALSNEVRQALVEQLMQARRVKGIAMKKHDVNGREAARQLVDRLKQELGERGPVWWTDGAPDWNRHAVAGTPYADWLIHVLSREVQ